MKNIYVVQNSELSFDMDISQLYSPGQYRLFLFVNKFGESRLSQRKQESLFEKIWVTDRFDFESLKSSIEENQKNNISECLIVTNAEESVSVCGQLRKYFKQESQDSDRFVHKVLMKELIKKSDLLYPNYIVFNPEKHIENASYYFDVISKDFKFPLIAKPIDSFNCQNVEKIENFSQLKMWVDCVKKGSYEIDEFIDGKVYNCDSYIKNNEIIFTQVSETSNSCYDFMCGKTKGTIALPHNDPIFLFLSNYTRQVHAALGYPKAGVTHLEVILTSDNTLYFLEIAHRSPGILIPAMYKKFLNVGTIEPHVLLQIDSNYVPPIKQGPFCAWIAFPRVKGQLIKKYVPNINSEHYLEWVYEVGDQMDSVAKGRDYAGRMLLWNNDYDQLKKDFYYLNSFHFFDIKTAC